VLASGASDIGSMIALATSVLRAGKDSEPVRNTIVPAPGRPVVAPPRPPVRPLET